MQNILIVGSGLAGISIIDQLLQRGVRVAMISDLSAPSSTKVATGMFNPIVFRRLNKTWMIDEVLSSMNAFYKSLEKKIGATLKTELRLFKHISSNDYLELWNKRADESEFAEYLIPVKKSFGEVKKAGWVDCSALCTNYHSYLIQHGILRNEKFDFAQLASIKDGIKYRDEYFDAIVFCEGPYAIDNPYFKWLPFKVAKGDWVVIETEKDLKLKGVINNIVNVIPLGNNRYKLSSTFEWESSSWAPNKNATKELLEAFEELFSESYAIVDHQSGLRPSASDRRPYLGPHPRHPKIYIFNGLGSKGVILAPYFSNHLAEHLLEKKPLMPEVDINRHIKRYREYARMSEISS